MRACQDIIFFRQYVWKYRRAVVVYLLFIILVFYNCGDFLAPAVLDSVKLYENFKPEINDDNQACQIPFYHPFEPDVMSFFTPPISLRCRANMPMLTFIDVSGILRRNATAFKEAGYTFESLTCVYQEIWKGADDSKVVFSESRPMTGRDVPESDFVFVSCWRFSWLPRTYAMYHAATQRNAKVREFEDDEEIGVAVVGLDSVSRLNFMRQLPRSYQALTDTLNGVVFKGFNKVGFNTFPNIVPILTGSPPRQTSDNTTFDDWPLLWRPLTADGVATLYGEDMSLISTFSWWGAGFRSKPTTHYFRPFWVAFDSSMLNSFSSALCVGPAPKHRVYLDYLLSFLRTYRKSPQFMFSLENEPSHDYMNTVGIMDRDLESFLLTAHGEGLLNRTILFVIADHGHRMDVFRQTELGRLEDFMPMVSMVLPPWLTRKYPHLVANLRTNSKRLTSSYDLFSTFTDIFTGKSFRKKRRQYNFPVPVHGQSLFQPIPLERTCEQAGIPEIFCICKENSQNLNVGDPFVQKSIKILLDYMNNQVLNGSSQLWRKAMKKMSTKIIDEKCSRLALTTVEKASLFIKPDRRKIIFLKYHTLPNDGVYEGHVQWNDNGLGSIFGEISRTNRYGNQADCLNKELLINYPFVRSACYCV